MMPAEHEKIVVVTRKTAVEELIERFNTRDQARFYIEHSGASFAEYEAAHDAYAQSLAALKRALPEGVRAQFVERAFLPNFVFGERDLIVTLGPDGLVVNTAKYLNGQPLLALNPDPARIEGILAPFAAAEARGVLARAVRGALARRRISMARATLNDGQSLYAVNDLFIGQQTHVSARYRLRFGQVTEAQSSSGIIVSTGAGSTGWLRSIVTGAAQVAGAPPSDPRFDWDADCLRFSVREPFVSKTSSARLVFERIEAGQHLEIVSEMPQNGVIFSDGIEEDYLPFNSGAIARVALAEKKVHLLVRP